MAKEDCFAYVNENECLALRELEGRKKALGKKMFTVVLATQQRNKTYINIQNTEKLNYNMFLQMNVVQSVKKISSFSKMEK